MTTPYTIDTAHSGIHFAVRHMVISKVRGRFTKWSANLVLDDSDLTGSRVDVTIDTASIDTQVGDRDNHLRSPDFLDAAQFPSITFKSKTIEKRANDYHVRGELTIHGVTREVTLDTELVGRGKDMNGNERVGFAAKTSIDRKDFGLKWNVALEAGGLLVGEKVEIEIEIEAQKGAAK